MTLLPEEDGVIRSRVFPGLWLDVVAMLDGIMPKVLSVLQSGIPNHAFYLAVTEIGGYAWEKAGKIWYIALRDRLRHDSNFADAAKITIAVVGELYGAGSKEQNALTNAWKTVGVL